MIWEIQWSGPGLKDLHRLDPQIQARVLRALRRLAETGQGDLIRLQGPRHQLRLRVGDWRVGLTASNEPRMLRVDWVRPRGRAYRD